MLLCGLCTTFMTTSCLNSDDDDNGASLLTRSDSIEFIMQAMGPYSGKLSYLLPETTSSTLRRDSVDVSWTVSQYSQTIGTVAMTGFPVSALAALTATVGGSSETQAILAAAPTQTLEFVLYPYQKSSSQTATQYVYWLLPKNNLEFTVEYDGSEHAVVIEFAGQLYSSTYQTYISAIAAKYGSGFEGNILISSVSVDNNKCPVQTYYYFHN